MTRIFEITTIARKSQRYEIVEVSSDTFPDGSAGFSMRHVPEASRDFIDDCAMHAYHAYALTGLDEVIRSYPASLVAAPDGASRGRLELARPGRLRMIYDVFPDSCATPILRICPAEGQLFLQEYDPKKAKLPLEHITFSNEHEGSLDAQFTGLRVLLHLRNFEKENEFYYGHDLKKNLP